MGGKLAVSGIMACVVLIIGCFIYGSYWVAKHVSYSLFYEDMVQETIEQMVKPEALIGQEQASAGNPIDHLKPAEIAVLEEKIKNGLFVLPPAPRYPAAPEE